MEGDESALAKLGGAMTDTALAILMAGIVASHLRMHHCKRDDADNDCYNDDDDDDGEGGVRRGRSWWTPPRLPRTSSWRVGSRCGGGAQQ